MYYLKKVATLHVEEGQLFYVDQQGDGSTFNCLVNRARKETDRNFYNFMNVPSLY